MKKIIILFIGLFLFTSIIEAKNRKISGKVSSSEDGSSLPGVVVKAVGANAGTLTDAFGKFTLEINENIHKLELRFLGFQPHSVNISSNDEYNIQITPDAYSLNEVVVTALGVSKEKKSLGYSTQELSSKDVSEAKESNIVNALSGKIAGVRITNSQGDIGSSRIIIRGETSIAGYNQPLFVIDGIPVDNSQLGAGGSRDFRNAIADINPEDIETLSVLKGPNAAALYGSRAAHGAILIKTKSGKGQKGLGITFNSNTTFSSVLTLPKYQNEFGQGSNGLFSYVDGKGAGVNDGVDESWGPKLNGQLIPQFNSNGEAVPFIAHPNNVRDYFKTGVTYNNGVSIAGSGDKYDIRLSLNNEKQYGIEPNSKTGKTNVSVNTNYSINNRLKVGATGNYIINDSPNLPASGGKRSSSAMLQFAWFGRQVDINELKANQNNNWNNSYYSNLYWVANNNTTSQRKDRIIGDIHLNYTIADGLTFNLRSGTDTYNDRRKAKIAYGTNGTPYGSYEEDAYRISETNTEAILRYNKNINKEISLDVLGGYNVRNRTFEQNYQQAPRLAVAGLYTLANSRDPLVSSNFYSKLRTYSSFASAQIGYKSYAYLNLTARNDWSSTLPKENQSYFYPSVNASIILTDAFNIKSSVLSFAKIRGGWSKVGSDADPYQLYTTFNSLAAFNGNPQLTSSGVGLNEHLKSESTNSTELGLDLGLFRNRIRLDISLYNTNSIDQILKLDVSAASGYSQKLLNAGKINNKGLEIQLDAAVVKQPKFSWDLGVNFATNKSRVKVLDYEKRIQNYVIGSYGSVQVVASVDKPYGTLLGNAYLRDNSGNIIVNANGLPQADPTQKVLGKFTPDWTGGITNSFSYKGFNLSFLIDASIGGSLYSGTNRTGSYTGVLANTLPGRSAENGGLYYYYPGNIKANGTVASANGQGSGNGEYVYDDGMIFKGVTADGKQNTKIISASQYYKSTYSIDEQYVYSSSFVKFRELKLAYNFRGEWLKKLNLTGASVGVVGRNLFFIYKDVPNIDPENAFSTGNAQGLESLSLPTTRSYGVNISLKF